MMEFTYKGYAELLKLLAGTGYAFTDYHHYMEQERCVILRHDIDRSLRFTLPLAEIEAEHQATSTWFVRLSSDMYNALSQTSRNDLRSLQSMGHEIGLHFDEAAYAAEDGTMEDLIRREADILANALGFYAPTRTAHPGWEYGYSWNGQRLQPSFFSGVQIPVRQPEALAGASRRDCRIRDIPPPEYSDPRILVSG